MSLLLERKIDNFIFYCIKSSCTRFSLIHLFNYNIISEVCLLNDKTPKKHVCKVIPMHMAPFLYFFLRFNIEVVFFFMISIWYEMVIVATEQYYIWYEMVMVQNTYGTKWFLVMVRNCNFVVRNGKLWYDFIDILVITEWKYTRKIGAIYFWFTKIETSNFYTQYF
jgi:hypothetical protein